MPPWVANWMLTRPRTESASASRRVASADLGELPGVTFQAGSTEKESPEWIPASSMCCWMPPIQVVLAVGERVHVELERRRRGTGRSGPGCSGELASACAM